MSESWPVRNCIGCKSRSTWFKIVQTVFLSWILSGDVGFAAAERFTPKNRRILYNLDGDSAMTLRAGRKGPGPMTTGDLTNLVAELTQPGSQVDTLLVCINAQVMYYPTKKGTQRGALSTEEERGQWSPHERQRFENMQNFFNSGLDPYAILLGEAKRRGLEALLTFRMNDAHGNDFLRTAFWRDHPEFRLSNGGLDFAHDEVRDYVFGLIEEAVQRYDCDGLELDFQRFPTFFNDRKTEENVVKINAIVERVRRLLDTEGTKRGRHLVLAARAPSDYGQGPPTYQQSISVTKSCDPAEWARQGWINFLTVSEWLFTADTLDLKSWRQRVSGIPIYTAIQPEAKPSSNKSLCDFCIGAEGYRRVARERWTDGADGIYLFNFFTTREWAEPREPPFQVLAQIGSLKTLAALPPSTAIRLRSPLDFQVFQRTKREEGSIVVAGSLTEVLTDAAALEVRLVGVGSSGTWQKLTILPPGQTEFGEFRSELIAPAGGWYRLDVRLKRQDTTLAVASVEHVGVGEVFVIAGQSNSANHGEEKQQPLSGLVVTGSGQKWRIADDPQPGASGGGGSFVPSFADEIANRFKVPVGIVAAGAGGTSVREWLPFGTRFPNPPTVLGNVTPLPNGEWESKGQLFDNLMARIREVGPHGFRAVLWHQGESDANQSDTTRTLSGELYRKYMIQIIGDTRREMGWEFPWFVAQASYHTPVDTGSSDIRAAQAALWKLGVALEGPDTDLLMSEFRESGGKGVHFNGKGLREHGAKWAEKVSPWLEERLATGVEVSDPAKAKVSGPTPKLILPDMESFTVENRPAFTFLPSVSKRTIPQPWIFYAPTLPGYPDGAERWMHEQFLAAGIAVAGVDVGEAYGSPKSLELFDALYRELTVNRGFAGKPCLFGRSRGGLWVSSWAIANPSRIAGIIGIYPVFDFRTYPGLKNAAPAYGLTPAELEARATELNPIARIGVLASARVPAALIHGNVDTVVPLKENSAEFVRRYKEAGVESLVKLIVLEGQGHNYYEGFFNSQEIVDFAIGRAREGAKN